MFLPLFFALIKFSWEAPPQPPNVHHYKLCASTVSGRCDVIKETDFLELALELDPNKVWYAYVKAVNPAGESEPSNIVIVGKPKDAKGLKWGPVGDIEKKLRAVCGKKCAGIK